MEKLKDIFLTKHFSIRNIKFSLEELFCVTVICFLSVLLLQNFITLLDTTVWRHDALYYIDTYYNKLYTEGRWINYIFFKVLKVLPPHLVIAISLACFCFFGYRVAKDFIDDELFAIIFALALVQIHPIYALIHWPAVFFPNFIYLALAPPLKKVLRNWVFFVCFGILFFGSHFNFYNLLPLLFLSDLKDTSSFMKVLILWVLGFIVGCAVTEVMTFFMAGCFVRLADWRQVHTIESLQDLFLNIQTEFQWLCSNMRGFFARPSLKIVYCYLILHLGYLIFKNSIIKKSLLLIIAVILSLYLQLIPIGVYVMTRTAVPLYCALLCVPLCCYYKKSLRSIAIFTICLIAFGLWCDNTNDLSCYNEITNAWQTELKSVCSVPVLHKGLKVYLQSGSEAEIAASEQIIYEAIDKDLRYTEELQYNVQWVPVARSIGFRQVKIYNHKLSKDFTNLSPNELYRYGYKDGYLHLTVNQKYLDNFTD